MKFVTFRRDRAAQPGLLHGSEVIALRSAGFHSVLEAITGGQAALARIQEVALKPPAGDVFLLSELELLAPIPRPPKIICIGLNYRDHAIDFRPCRRAGLDWIARA